MRILAVLLTGAIALSGISCGGTTPPPGDSANALNNPDANATAAVNPTTPDATPRRVASAPRLEGDAPPKDARYTLFCQVVRGPEHVIRATQLKEDLIRRTGLRTWHLLHTDAQSMLYFGYYRSFDDRDHDPAEVARAQADLRRINELKDAGGERLFRTALFVSIDEPDPEAPAQWDLAKAGPNAYWSLQVGAYRGSPDRKQYAVDAVRAMRAHGIKAFYFHGESISSVCVGVWPREAIKEQESHDARSDDPNAVLLVANDKLDGLNADLYDREGHKLVVEAPKLEVTDPTLAQAIRDFPNHAINGEVLGKRGKNGVLIPDASFLVTVPHNSDAVSDSIATPGGKTGAATPADQATNQILDNPATPPPGFGRLRSIGQ